MLGFSTIGIGRFVAEAVIVAVADDLEHEPIAPRHERDVPVADAVAMSACGITASLPADRTQRLVAEQRACAIAGCVDERLLLDTCEVGRRVEVAISILPPMASKSDSSIRLYDARLNTSCVLRRTMTLAEGWCPARNSMRSRQQVRRVAPAAAVGERRLCRPALPASVASARR